MRRIPLARIVMVSLVSLLTTVCSAAEQSSDSGLSQSELDQGKAVFEQWCWQCHGKTNPHGSGTWSLAKRSGDPRSPYLEERTDLVPEFIYYVVRHGQLFMPKFRITEISDEELKALSTYLSSASTISTPSTGALIR